MNQLQPQTILGVAAHPDDLDFGMAGSIAKWIDDGAEAYYLILTNGNKGTHDRSLSPKQLRDLRRDEQRAAAKILGVKEVFFYDFDDGELCCDQDIKKCIVEVIRKVRPDTVLTMDPSMLYSARRGFINHSDHRAAGEACMDAVYPLARDHLAFPDLDKQGLKPHETSHLLLMNFDNANYYVDITDTLDQKLNALRAHKSQIDPVATLKLVTDEAKLVGKKAGCQYAEGFVRIDVR